MKQFKHLLALAGIASALCLTTTQLQAQDRPGRGNFDPEEFRQRMMERLREDLEVKNDDEWKIIEPRIAKVQEAQRELAAFGGMGGFGRGGFGPGGPGGPGARGGDDNDRGPGGRRGFRGGQPSPEVQALRQAIEDNASADDVKAKLAAYRKAREAREAGLGQARADLKKVLSVKQEAIAVMRGLLE